MEQRGRPKIWVAVLFQGSEEQPGNSTFALRGLFRLFKKMGDLGF